MAKDQITDEQKEADPQPMQYVNWAVSTQCRAGDASEAMDAAFQQGYSNADEGTTASFETAKKMVLDFLGDEEGWFQINASGSHPHTEGERKHLSVAVMPVTTPHGVK